MDFERLITDFLVVLMEFLLEMYILYYLFQFGMKRKPHFYLRFLIGAVVMVLVVFASSFLYHFYGKTIWGRVLTYLFIFVMSIVHLSLCYDESIWSILFCSLNAYAAQNLAYKAYLFVLYFFIEGGVIPGWLNGQYYEILYRLYYFGINAAFFAAIYFVFARKIREYRNLKVEKYNIIIISIFIMLITVLLCTIQDIYVDQQSFLLRQTSNVLSVISCVCVLLLLSSIMDKKALKSEIEILQYTMRSKEDQYKLSKETIDLINIKCHDMRHRLDDLRTQGGSISSKEFSELEEAISIYDSNIQTGNETLAVILTDKKLYCEKHGIVFSCMVNGEKLSFISENDIYSLFGNIIENAIEAAEKLKLREQRTINLIVKTKGEMLLIQSENYFSGAMKFQDGFPLTTKQDKDYHGFGMKSIRYIVHKYHGEVTSWADGNIFRLSILFPLQSLKTET